VLELRAKGQSDLVDIAQVFQRSGTRSVSWKSGKGPAPLGTADITSPEQYAGKKVGVWDFGNEYEVTAAGLKFSLVQNVDYTKVIQPFNMSLLLNREIDVAEAMIYNEYAQVLEAKNAETGELNKPTDLNVINYNDVGMLRTLFARASWLSQAGNEDIDSLPQGVVPGLDLPPHQQPIASVHGQRGLDPRGRPPGVDDERSIMVCRRRAASG
jgi:hypothetical protein